MRAYGPRDLRRAPLAGNIANRSGCRRQVSFAIEFLKLAGHTLSMLFQGQAAVALERRTSFLDKLACPGHVVDVELHMFSDDARHGIFNAVVVAGLDLRLQPLLLLTGKGDGHGPNYTPFGSATQS